MWYNCECAGAMVRKRAEESASARLRERKLRARLRERKLRALENAAASVEAPRNVLRLSERSTRKTSGKL